MHVNCVMLISCSALRAISVPGASRWLPSPVLARPAGESLSQREAAYGDGGRGGFYHMGLVS